MIPSPASFPPLPSAAFLVPLVLPPPPRHPGVVHVQDQSSGKVTPGPRPGEMWRPGQKLLAHRRTESRLRMPRSSPSCHQVLEKQPQPTPSPRPPVAAPTLPPGQPGTHPHPTPQLRPHWRSASGPDSRNSPRLQGCDSTHWRTLMKPSGSSSRRQCSPTSRRSTCRAQPARGQGGGTREGAALFLHSHAGEGAE